MEEDAQSWLNKGQIDEVKEPKTGKYQGTVASGRLLWIWLDWHSIRNITTFQF